MKIETNIKENYVSNLLYQILNIIVPIITTPYVSRILQADGIGDYSYSLSIVTYFSMIASLGMTTYGQLEMAKNRDNIFERSKLFWEILFSRMLLMILVIIVYVTLEPFFAVNINLYKVMTINIVAGTFDVSFFFQGIEQFKIIIFRNVIIKIVCTICIFIFVQEKKDLLLYAIILQGSMLIGNILLWPHLKSYIELIGLKYLKFNYLWKNSLVYFVPTIATSVYTVLDKSMLGILTKSSFESGYYEQAHKIEQILVVVLTSLSTITLPRLAYLWNSGEKKSVIEMYNNTTNFILLLAFPMMFGVSVIADRLIPSFLGSGYEPCIGILRIFSVLLIIIGLNNTIGKQCLMAIGRQKLYNRGVITGAGVNFIVNFFLISFLGARGAAIGSVMAEGIILLIFLYYSRDVLDTKILLRGIIRYGCIGGIMAIVTWISGFILPDSMIGMGVQIFVGILVYIMLLVISKDSFFRKIEI